MDSTRRGGVREDADMGEFFQAVDAARVIAVFMRDENGVDAVERFPHAREQRGEFSHGKARVDEHACAFRDEQRCVARTAATKNTKTHRHAASC